MAMMERRAEIVWEGDIRGSGRLRVDSEAFPEQTVTFAARTEAADGKTSPEELIAAAHATCYAMALSNTIKQAGGTPERLDVSAVCSLDRVEGALKITAMKLTVRGKAAGVDAAGFAELAKTAEGRCPVSNALRGSLEITVEVTVK